MASMVKATGSTCTGQLASVQENGSRNKRKFRADTPMVDGNKILPSTHNECVPYEFSAEKFEAIPGHGLSSACDMCGVSEDHSNGLKLDLGLSGIIASSEIGQSQPREELVSEDSHDADWSDLTESQLEELVLSNLDAIFKCAIKKIVACGYIEEVATKAVLRSGLCYGCKDTVSNIVDNTLAFLRNGQEIDPSREHCFQDLQQLERYILAEVVCVLREVKPFFSTGDAMWCLLISDMNVSHACAMDGDPLGGFVADGTPGGTSSTSSQSQLKEEAKCSETKLLNPGKPIASSSCVGSAKSEVPTRVIGVHSKTKPKNSSVLSGVVAEKEGSLSTSGSLNKSLSIAGTSQSPILEEKFAVGRKVHSSSGKREYILRQKSLHLEKSYRMYGSKGSRAGKLSGFSSLILDKKLKSVSDTTAVSIKNTSLRLSTAMGVEAQQENGNQNVSSNLGPSSPKSFDLEASVVSPLPKTSIPSSSPPLPPIIPAPALSSADTELCLSLPTKSNSSSVPVSHPEVLSCDYTRMNDLTMKQWVPQDKKDLMIMKLLPRVRELQNQLQEWTEWANQKVMQAARRLSKDKAELKSLRQEKEEVDRLKKEKQSLEESTRKKLTEMENAMYKASGEVERAISAVRRLEVENAALRQEMEAAKFRAAESAASCQEVSKREKKTLMKFQSWEKQKTIFQEELAAERHKAAQLLKDLDQASQVEEQYQARWQQEKKAKDELLTQASSMRKEREQIEVSSKSKEGMIRLKAETKLQKYKDDIRSLEKEISQLRLKSDSSKIAALRRGIDGSYASKVAEKQQSPARKENRAPHISEAVKECNDNSEQGGLKRERECVMCLSEEMSVVFLPCGHQVVCASCNELHEKQGMKDCPSCRGPIQRRISVRYASS